MTKVNRNRVLVSLNEWKTLKNAARVEPDEDKFYVNELAKPAPATKSPEFSTTKPLPDFIDCTKKKLKKNKILPLDLRRALFLSDVFTEKENHLNFTKKMQKMRHERKLAEDERLLNAQRLQAAEQREKDIKILKARLSLGKRLKEEVCCLKRSTKESRCRIIEKEKTELERVKQEYEEEDEKQRLANLQKKNDLRKLCEEDLRQTLEERQKSEKRDLQNRTFDCLFPLTKAYSPRKLLKKRKTTRAKTLTSSEIVKSSVTDYAFQSLSSKSEIERKREQYERKLKEERINVHYGQIREVQEKKEFENYEKRTEFAQRFQNLDVTDSFFSRKNLERFETMKENRNAWSQQCEERKLRNEKERLEDVHRLEKLKNDLRNEDKEYLEEANAACRQCKIAGKNIFPILKCIKEFTKNRKIPTPPKS